jgi:hypothetical protein
MPSAAMVSLGEVVVGGGVVTAVKIGRNDG